MIVCSRIYSGYSAPGKRIAGMEIRVFRNENSSQNNAYSHYSNYSYSGLIPNERALNFCLFYAKFYFHFQKINRRECIYLGCFCPEINLYVENKRFRLVQFVAMKQKRTLRKTRKFYSIISPERNISCRNQLLLF